METQNRCFPYEISIVINALYDTIEALGLRLDCAASARGMLLVSEPGRSGAMRIALEAADGPKQTRVSVLPDGADTGVFFTWSEVILDELFGTIRRACTLGDRKLTKERDAL